MNRTSMQTLSGTAIARPGAARAQLGACSLVCSTVWFGVVHPIGAKTAP